MTTWLVLLPSPAADRMAAIGFRLGSPEHDGLS